jgi:hypothetical protein
MLDITGTWLRILDVQYVALRILGDMHCWNATWHNVFGHYNGTNYWSSSAELNMVMLGLGFMKL